MALQKLHFLSIKRNFVRMNYKDILMHGETNKSNFDLKIIRLIELFQQKIPYIK